MSDWMARLERYPMLRDYTAPVKKAERKIIGRDKEIEQIQAALMRPEICNVMLLAPAGSGKALANGTPIPVADDRGYAAIETLQPGDRVFDENGQPVVVSGVYPQGLKHVYRVTFSDGTSLLCNDEHLWNVRSAWAHKQQQGYQTLTLREMLNRGIRRKFEKTDGRISYETSWYVPEACAVVRDEIDLPVHPYVVGALLGDGCLSNPASGYMTIASDDVFVVDKVAALIGAAGVWHSRFNYNWQFLNTPADKVRLGRTYIKMDDLLSDECFSDTMRSVKSVQRSIPAIYFNGSIEQRRELLHGLMDTDGCITGGFRANCSYCTNSESMAYGMQQLAASLGYRTSVVHNDRLDKVHANREYEVHFRIPNEKKCELFTLPRHLDKLEQCLSARKKRASTKRFGDVGIARVDDLGYDTEMTCIYVDSESHLFQAGYEHIVTHNTALVQGTMLRDKARLYLEVDLAKMIANLNDPNEMAARLKMLFDETAAFVKDEGKEIVLFIDEFHQVVQLSAAAVEALKPLLADSGTRGIRVIAATTFVEFREYIARNQPLVERLQRINLAEPNKEMTVAIMRGMLERYGMSDKVGDDLLKQIYEYTNRYMPSNAQPRKSILVLDAMLGWNKAFGRKMDMRLLADVIYNAEGVNVTFRVDAINIKQELDKVVLSQDFATKAIADRLQICVADLNDKSKPMSSFLFTGSSGVGKTAVCKALAKLLFESDRSLIRFDMTEYANADSLDRFRRELTNQVWARPYSLLLLDEVEKACSECTRLLLQVLDDGRLIDENGRVVSFLNCYIVMTTNAGSTIYKQIAQYSVDDTGSGKQMRKYDKLIREAIIKGNGDNKFPPELLGRIDCIVPFQPLSEDTMRRIALMNFRRMANEVKQKHGVVIKREGGKDDDRVIRYLVEDTMDTDSDSGGARAVMSKLESEVVVPIASFINAHPDVKYVLVRVEGQLVRDNKNIRESDAHIVVSEFVPENK